MHGVLPDRFELNIYIYKEINDQIVIVYPKLAKDIYVIFNKYNRKSDASLPFTIQDAALFLQVPFP